MKFVYRSIGPWLKTKKGPEGGREYMQLPKDRRNFDGLGVNILI